jgi:hypothetical protein
MMDRRDAGAMLREAGEGQRIEWREGSGGWRALESKGAVVIQETPGGGGGLVEEVVMVGVVGT